MSGNVFQPLLILCVPAGQDVDPQAWESLQRYAADEYGAGVMLNVGGTPDDTARPQLLGDWPQSCREVLRDLTPQIDQVFFNLDWLEEVV